MQNPIQQEDTKLQLKNLQAAQRFKIDKSIVSCNSPIVKALEINNGPSNIDLIFDKRDGQAKIIEVGARIGATCLPELVEYFSGIDWVKIS